MEEKKDYLRLMENIIKLESYEKQIGELESELSISEYNRDSAIDNDDYENAEKVCNEHYEKLEQIKNEYEDFKLSLYFSFNQFEEVSKLENYERQIIELESEIHIDEYAQSYDDSIKNNMKTIESYEKLEQLKNEYEQFKSSLYSSIKKSNELDIDMFAAKEDIFSIFDKKTGNYIEVTAQVEKVKDEVISDKEKEEITLDKILDELINRKDLKALSLNIHINNKSEIFMTSEEPGKSIADAVNKIREAVKDFEEIVIVYSREELELLQKQYREENGLELPAEKSESKAEDKNYKNIKAEFISQINNDSSMARGYIRISDEDYAKLGDILDNNEIPHIAKQSEYKEGINIIIPIDKMDQLKDIISSKDIKCLQIVHGNVDWQDIKGTKNMCIGVAKEDFLKFQEHNNNKFRYIAFESDKGFSVYMEKDCNIKIKTKAQANKEKLKNENSKGENTSKKTVAKAKEEINNIKKDENYKGMIKDEFTKQINNDSSMEKGYISISNEDFDKLGDILDKNKTPYTINKSKQKDVTDIIVPIDKMNNLKDVLSSKNIKCFQIVYGNIDLQHISNREVNACVYVTKEELSKFQELNNNRFGYVAVENGDGKSYSVYTMKNCNIPINLSHLARMIESEDQTIEGSSKENADKKKTLETVKNKLEDTKKNDIYNSTQNKEQTKNEKER